MSPASLAPHHPQPQTPQQTKENLTESTAKSQNEHSIPLPQNTTPMQREILYLLNTELPTKLDNMCNFLRIFIRVLNPDAMLPASVSRPPHQDDLASNPMQSSPQSSPRSAQKAQNHQHSTTATAGNTLNVPKQNTSSSSKRSSTSLPIFTPPHQEPKIFKFRISNIAVGHFQISGFQITQAKVNLKVAPSSSSSSSSHLYILKQPYVLHNLQKSHHLAIEALDRMYKIIKRRQRDIHANLSSKLILERMYRALSEEMRLMIQVKEQLENDFEQLSCPLRLQLVIPHASVQRMQDSFRPNLPRDHLLEFSIHHGQCTVSLYKLLIANPHRLKDIVNRLHAPTRNLSIQMPDGSHHGYIQHVYRTEVMENRSYLQDAAVAIRNAYQTCARLKEKLDQLRDFDV